MKKSSLDIVVLIPNNTKINKSYLINFKIKRIGLFSGHLWEQISLPYFLYKNGFPLILNFSNSSPMFYSKKFVTIHYLSIYYDNSRFSFYYVFFYYYDKYISSQHIYHIILLFFQQRD